MTDSYEYLVCAINQISLNRIHPKFGCGEKYRQEGVRSSLSLCVINTPVPPKLNQTCQQIQRAHEHTSTHDSTTTLARRRANKHYSYYTK